MKIRMALSVIVVLLMLGLTAVYNAGQGPMESSIAVKQLEDNAVTYAAAQKVAEGHLPVVWNGLGICILGIMWVPFAARKMREL